MNARTMVAGVCGRVNRHSMGESGAGRRILVEKRVGCNVLNTFINISSTTEAFFKLLAPKMSVSKLLLVTTRHAYCCAVNTVMN